MCVWGGTITGVSDCNCQRKAGGLQGKAQLLPLDNRITVPRLAATDAVLGRPFSMTELQSDQLESEWRVLLGEGDSGVETDVHLVAFH